MFGENIGTLALSVLYLLSVFGWGSLLLKFFRPDDTSFWSDFAGRLVAGLGVLYACCVVLGAAGVFHRVEAAIAIGAGVLISAGFLFDFAREAAHHWKAQQWSTGEIAWTASIGALILLQLAFGLTPLIFYDLQVYHLLAPAQFLQTGGFSHIPWNVLTNSPLAIQLAVGASLAMDPSGQVAKMLFAIFGWFTCIAAYLFVRSSGRRPALVAALFTLSIPEFWLMQALGVIDLAVAGLTILGAFWLREAAAASKWRSAALCGIAFGMTIGSRYQAVVLTGLVVLLVVIERVASSDPSFRWSRLVQSFAIAGVIAALLVCPWLIRNELHTGNPVYPLMHDSLGGPEWSADQASRFNLEALGTPFHALSGTQKILAPFTVLLAFPANGLFGTVLLLGALLALGNSNRDVRFAALLGLSGMLIWGVLRPAGGVPLVRFNAASIVLLLAVTGALLGSEWMRSNFGSVAAIVLSAGSCAIALVQLESLFPTVQSLVDPSVRSSLHQANVPASAAMDYANEHLDASNNKVLMIGETRGFWLQIPYIAPSAFNGPQLDSLFANNHDGDYARGLRQMGITHLIISFPELKRLHERYDYLKIPPDQNAAFNAWLQNLPHTFDDGHGTLLLAIPQQAPFTAVSN